MEEKCNECEFSAQIKLLIIHFLGNREKIPNAEEIGQYRHTVLGPHHRPRQYASIF